MVCDDVGVVLDGELVFFGIFIAVRPKQVRFYPYDFFTRVG